jgi:hypothetical protein
MKTRIALPLLVAVALSACDDTTASSGDQLSDAEVTVLSENLVTTAFDATTSVATADADVAQLDGATIAGDAVSSTLEFTRTVSCPLGGQVVLEGIRTREWDFDTWSGYMDFELTKTHESCVRPAREAEDVSITLDGAPDVLVSVHHEWADGQRTGIQSMSLLGAIDWVTSDGRSGTCEIDVEASFDPETHTRTVTGTVCDHAVAWSRQWQHSRMGG